MIFLHTLNFYQKQFFNTYTKYHIYNLYNKYFLCFNSNEVSTEILEPTCMAPRSQRTQRVMSPPSLLPTRSGHDSSTRRPTVFHVHEREEDGTDSFFCIVRITLHI